jgi:hypothetical protein
VDVGNLILVSGGGQQAVLDQLRDPPSKKASICACVSPSVTRSRSVCDTAVVPPAKKMSIRLLRNGSVTSALRETSVFLATWMSRGDMGGASATVVATAAAAANETPAVTNERTAILDPPIWIWDGSMDSTYATLRNI